MKHRDIQATHEESVLNSFKNFLSTQDLELDVVDKPDPPDAIVQLAGMVTWIEITDAFHDANWARSITSYKIIETALLCINRDACHDSSKLTSGNGCTNSGREGN